MTHHVVTLVSGETYTPDIPVSDQLFSFSRLDGDVVKVLSRMPRSIPDRVLDFLDVSIAMYGADRMVGRDQASWDGWQREITLHVPVRHEAMWRGEVGKSWRDLVNYLTGDTWHLVPRARPTLREYRPRIPRPPFPEAEAVALLSGGLDSFVGAIDLLTQRVPMLFVGHRGRNPSSGVSTSQRNVLEHLRTKYSNAELVPFFVAEPVKTAQEDSTRSRALLFFALAAATALGSGATRLVVPENGYLSLNVPLSLGYIGSFSTRSTHPHTIDLLRNLFGVLDIAVDVELPYHHQTKGEVLQTCQDQDLLFTGLTHTISCGHPSVPGRDSTLPPALRKPGQNCGYCLACLVRRAAIEYAFGDDPTLYPYGQPGEFPSTKTLVLEAVRSSLRSPSTADMRRILANGPLNVSNEDMLAFRDVYRRGQDELQTLLARRGL